MTIKDSSAEGIELFEALAGLNRAEDVRRFMTDLCTPKELADFSERWRIAQLLHRGGLSYRDISALTGASTTTIGRVARFLANEPHQGYRLVLDKAAPPDQGRGS
jgi:TrpR-related protein YerC/YecD